MRTYYGMMLGGRRAASGTVQLIDADYHKIRASPFTATASFGLLNTGAISWSGTPTPSGGAGYNWLTGGSASDFQARATVSSGAFVSGTTGTWVDCSTSPNWTVTDPGSSTSVTALFEIRRVSNGAIVADATISLSAEQV